MFETRGNANKGRGEDRSIIHGTIVRRIISEPGGVTRCMEKEREKDARASRLRELRSWWLVHRHAFHPQTGINKTIEDLVTEFGGNRR